jgi:hypothetical protein
VSVSLPAASGGECARAFLPERLDVRLVGYAPRAELCVDAFGVRPCGA